MERKYIRFFEELSSDDVAIAGGKNASLGELYRRLRPKGVLVPNGFAVTADAYCYDILISSFEGSHVGEIWGIWKPIRRS